MTIYRPGGNNNFGGASLMGQPASNPIQPQMPKPQFGGMGGSPFGVRTNPNGMNPGMNPRMKMLMMKLRRPSMGQNPMQEQQGANTFNL